MSKVAIVTGANQGLGLALVRSLCRQLGDQGLVYLTARDRQRGAVAVRQLQAEGLSPQFELLDVTSGQSVLKLAMLLQERHGGVDIVISNAAARIAPDLPPAQQVAQFVDTNNHGTYRMISAFTPLLKDGARFVVVASSFGSLRHMPNHLQHLFDAEQLTLEDIEATMDAYTRLVESGQALAEGWPEWINIPSKVGQVAAMRVMARRMREEAQRRDIVINAACPGLVDTDASRPWFTDMSTAQSPDHAAADLVWLATQPAGSSAPYGELVQHRQVIPFR
jgi:carbonyl reductase 1